MRKSAFFLVPLYSIVFLISCSNKDTENIVFNYNGGIDQSILDALKNGNYHEGIQGAGDYTSHNGVHPLVIIDDGGSIHIFSDLLPENLIPKTIHELEILAVLYDQEKILLNTCSYTDGYTLYRYQYSRKIEIYGAKSGSLLESGVIYGKEPAVCPNSVGVGSDSKTITYEGEQVTPDKIISYLTQKSG
jgi:hypothetical protein